MDKKELIEKIKANGEWFETNRYVKITKVIELINQMDQPQKVKVPAFVAKWISKCRELSWILPDLLAPEAFESSFARNTEEWLRQNKQNYDILARAWLDGYEVEDEPLFYIRLTIPSSSVVGLYLGFNKDGIFDHSYGKPHVTWDWKCTFTEQEIKSIDERYWPFAVPVEKV